MKDHVDAFVELQTREDTLSLKAEVEALKRAQAKLANEKEATLAKAKAERGRLLKELEELKKKLKKQIKLVGALETSRLSMKSFLLEHARTTRVEAV